MNKISFLLLIAILGFSSCKSAKLRKKTADEQVIDLQKGVLLVRLQTAEGKVSALQQLGKTEEAERVAADQQVLNQEIRLAFETHYDFSPVFFFYAPDSRLIRQRKFTNILFDTREQSVSSKSLIEQPFLVAEFNEVQAPATNAGLDALLLLDEQLKQLAMPFPYAVPTHLYDKDIMANKAVANLNLRLQDFYTKAVFRERKRELKKLRRRRR